MYEPDLQRAQSPSSKPNIGLNAPSKTKLKIGKVRQVHPASHEMLGQGDPVDDGEVNIVFEKERTKTPPQPHILAPVIQWLETIEPPQTRVARLRRWFRNMSCLQMFCGMWMCVFVGFQKDVADTFVNLFPSLLTVVCGACGLASALQTSEYLARMFFVSEMWLVSNLTLYLFFGMDATTTTQALCNPSQAQFSNTEQCQWQAVTHSKTSLSFFVIFFCVVCAVISRDFNDAVNDAELDSSGVRSAGMGVLYEQQYRDLAGDRPLTALRPYSR